MLYARGENKLLSKLIPFYVGIFIGYLTFRDPDNAWIYGGLGGLFMGIMLWEHTGQDKEDDTE